MSTGELIFLDTVDTTDVTGEEENDEEEFIIQLDITHAVQAWLEDPASNLGVKVIFTGVTEPPPMSSEPELATETRFLKRGVRTKRSTGDESIVIGPSDCPASQPTTPPINWSLGAKKRNTEKCCRYVSFSHCSIPDLYSDLLLQQENASGAARHPGVRVHLSAAAV